MREHREEKRKKFATFFAKCLAVGDSITFDEKRYYLEMLDEINEFDIQVIKVINEIGRMKVRDIPTPTLSELIVSLSKLETKGFISETMRGDPTDVTKPLGGIQQVDRWDNRWRRKWFELLPTGKEFIRFLVDE